MQRRPRRQIPAPRPRLRLCGGGCLQPCAAAPGGYTKAMRLLEEANPWGPRP
ncbi:hypothetical protein RBY4I_957 [Rhodobacterales bacterium Y4I]|nr:hypothetical protein RBY4I_957 [Rhodobacterales bacterium Y4I]